MYIAKSLGSILFSKCSGPIKMERRDGRLGHIEKLEPKSPTSKIHLSYPICGILAIFGSRNFHYQPRYAVFTYVTARLFVSEMIFETPDEMIFKTGGMLFMLTTFPSETIRMREKNFLDRGVLQICSSSVECSNFGKFQIFLKIPIFRVHN